MTDAEKTAVLVEKLFGGVCPIHKKPAIDACPQFAPFLRIDDAFAVVDRLMDKFWFRLDGVDGQYSASLRRREGTAINRSSDADTPARAIAEAAYLAVTAGRASDPIAVDVSHIEKYQDLEELPTIGEMSGLLEDATGGLSLKDYMERLRDE